MNPTVTSAVVYRNYIGGERKTASSKAIFDDEDPARKAAVLASFQASTPRDITEAVDAAAGAFPSWRRASIDQRQELGAHFVQLVRQKQEDLAVIVAKENGKTLREARAEVQTAVTEGTYHVYQTSRFCGHTLQPARRVAWGGFSTINSGWSASSVRGIFRSTSCVARHCRH